MWAKATKGEYSIGYLQINRNAGHNDRCYTTVDGELVKGKLADDVQNNGKHVKLVWGDDLDMVRYAAWHVRRDLDAGRSLYSACGWWSVRSNGAGAWDEYKMLSRVFKEKNPNG